MTNIEEKLLNKTDTTIDTKSNSELSTYTQAPAPAPASAPASAPAPMPIFFPAHLFISQKSNNINRMTQPTIQHVIPNPISRLNQKKRFNLIKMNF